LQAGQTGATFGPSTGAAAVVAGLFIILAATHLFLDPGVLNQLAKPLDRVANRLVFSQT